MTQSINESITDSEVPPLVDAMEALSEQDKPPSDLGAGGCDEPFGGMEDDHYGRQITADSSIEGGRVRPTESRATVKVSADFHRIKRLSPNESKDLSFFQRLRRMAEVALKGTSGDVALGIVVISDAVINCIDIDMRAGGGTTPSELEVMSTIFLAIYTVEFVAKLFLKRSAIFSSKWDMLDLLILLSGYGELLFFIADISLSQMGMVRLLRVVRMMRLVRVIRKFLILKELRKLMTMLASCVKTLFWSFCFLMCSMTVWSMVAVELVHPVILELAEAGELGDCLECKHSFSSVMRANLTLFKTVVAGDSWGEVAVPVIEHRPWTAMIFCGSLITLVFGVLNLIIAVVVDTAAEQRVKDVMNNAQDMDVEQQMDLKFLTKIFTDLDDDGSGELSLEELVEGAQTIPEFQSRLRVMDIDEADLVQLFHMLDQDGGGTISPDEFKFALSRWLHDSKTATRFVKYNVMKLSQDQQDMKTLLAQVARKVEKLRGFLKSGSGSHASMRDHSKASSAASVASEASLSSWSNPPQELRQSGDANGLGSLLDAAWQAERTMAQSLKAAVSALQLSNEAGGSQMHQREESGMSFASSNPVFGLEQTPEHQHMQKKSDSDGSCNAPLAKNSNGHHPALYVDDLESWPQPQRPDRDLQIQSVPYRFKDHVLNGGAGLRQFGPSRQRSSQPVLNAYSRDGNGDGNDRPESPKSQMQRISVVV